ncbi:MAG: ATP-dependent helicase UvrD/PcrA [Thermoleophilaceae bacterium]|nr:ATP-dependent helicase UvrD/PcrA [Thermoleophilaceae bacterium]
MGMHEPLDQEQSRAVAHPGGPLLVLGAAGTGKTRVLAARFEWLVGQGTSPGAILMLMGSPSAASEMLIRLETAIDQPYEELRVSTFQGFAEALLHEEALELGLDPDFGPVSAADRLAMLLERIDELPLRHHEIRGNPAPLIGGFISRIDRLKQEMITAEEYRRYAHSLAAGQGGNPTDADRAEADRELEFAAVYDHHDRMLQSQGALDSGDLILQAFRLLHEKPHVRRRQAERIQHVLVDEYEDVNFAQAALLKLLCSEHRNVTVAGDDDQGIHRFRAAAAKNLTDFELEYADATVARLEHDHRSAEQIRRAALAVVAPIPARLPKELAGREGGTVRFWHCLSERGEAQAVAREAERLVAAGTEPRQIAVLVRSTHGEGVVVTAALQERALPARLTGSAAYFQRAEVRDVLAWLRLLSDPGDSGAVVRALSRAPIGLVPVDIARVTQHARRRKLDMVAGVAAACEGPQLSPEGRERATNFLRLYRAAHGAFDEMRPDQFLHRLIERIGLRRNQLFAPQPDTVERLLNIAKLGELASGYIRREPGATARDFARYLAAVAEAGLPEPEAVLPQAPDAVQVMTIEAAKGREFDHVFIVGLTASHLPGPVRRAPDALPDALLKEMLPADDQAAHEAAMRRLLHLGIARARESVTLSWAEVGDSGQDRRASAFYEDAREALDAPEELQEEELFGPAEGLHSTFRMMRDEVLDTVARLGGQLKDLRLDTYMDVSQGVTRYLELVKLAALIERAKDGQSTEEALADVNEVLLQSTTPEQRDAYLTSALDDYLRDAEGRRAGQGPAPSSEPSLESFIPRRGDGLMLSASDIETYRICPLKYKFARVFRIPQEPTVNQRFGIVVHQVLERFHTGGEGSLEELMELFENAWRRGGFTDSNDDLQFHERGVQALRDYWQADRDRTSEPVSFERSFSFKLGPHLLRGRVDRVDRLPDGGHELIDYKTGKPRTAEQLREDIQLSVYQMGARESWGMETSAQSYYYVMDNEKVPVEHSESELARVQATIAQIADGITAQEFEPTPSPEICPFCDYRIICPAAEK